MPDQSIDSGSHNIQALIKDSPNARIEINERVTAQLLVPAFRPLTAESLRSELDLLMPRSTVTSFVGRDDVWSDVVAWCMGDATVSLRCITGRSGTGKTRLALELVHHLRTLADWDARFVEFIQREPFDLWDRTNGRNHVLLVFDNAGDVSEPLAASVRRLANELPKRATRKLRILLLARHADWDEGWLSSLQSRSAIEESVRDHFQPEEPIALSPLREADRLVIYRQAMMSAAQLTRSVLPAGVQPSAFDGSLARELADPLSLIMAAVTAVRSASPEPVAVTFIGLAHEVARSLAQEATAAFPENPQLALHMAAYATLSGGLSRDEAQDALAAESVSNNLGSVQNPGGFVERLRTWLPGERTEIGPITPDLIGGAFLLGHKNPRLLKPESTILRAMALHRDDVLRTLIRLTQDFCLAKEEARREPLTWLQIVIEKGLADDFGLLRDIESALPDSTVVLRRHALAVTLSIVERLRNLPNEQVIAASSFELIAQMASMLNNLSNRLSSLAAPGPALKTAEGAVAMYRQLSAFGDAEVRAGLAAALNTESNARSGMGMIEQALRPAEEAVALCRALIGNDPRTTRNLVKSLITLANRRAELGLVDSAVTTAAEAVGLSRELVGLDGVNFVSELAHALIVLALDQSELQQDQAAHASAVEAVRLRRELVRRNRDAFLPDLAHGLGVLSTTEGALGRHAEAIATAEESVALYRELATYSPKSFVKELVFALGVLSLRYGDAEHRQDALTAAQEASQLIRNVAREEPAFNTQLVTTLINLCKAQIALGLADDALSSAREAFDTAVHLVEQSRSPHLPQLAMAADNLGVAQFSAGRAADAVNMLETALTCYRELIQQSASAYLPDMATVLLNQAGVLSTIGKIADAETSAREAVATYRTLAAGNEERFTLGLAGALVNHGRVLGALSRFEDSALAFQEAISLARQPARAYAVRFLPVLALALNNLAAAQGALNRHEDALSSAIDAVAQYSSLHRLYGDAHAVEAARSRHTLGVALASVDRLHDAIESFRLGLEDMVRLGQTLPQAREVLELLRNGYFSLSLAVQQRPDARLLEAAAQLLNQ